MQCHRVALQHAVVVVREHVGGGGDHLIFNRASACFFTVLAFPVKKRKEKRDVHILMVLLENKYAHVCIITVFML